MVDGHDVSPLIYSPLDISSSRWTILSSRDPSDKSLIGLIIKPSFWNQLSGLEVPASWLAPRREISLAPVNSLDEARERLLKALLLEVKDRFLLTTTPGEVFVHRQPYPELNIHLNTFPDTGPLSIKTAMFNILSQAIDVSYEQVGCDVMHSMLRPFFDLPGCCVYESLSMPPVIAASNPLPLLENRLIISETSDTIWPSLQVSILWDARTLEEGQARLASHFDWPLKFILLLHRSLILETSPNDSISMSQVLPEWCHLLGILCYPSGVIVYSHHPRWDAVHKRWDFVSTKICTEPKYTFVHPTFTNRVHLLKTLLSVQRHTAHVREQMQKLISSDFCSFLTTLFPT